MKSAVAILLSLLIAAPAVAQAPAPKPAAKLAAYPAVKRAAAPKQAAIPRQAATPAAAAAAPKQARQRAVARVKRTGAMKRTKAARATKAVAAKPVAAKPANAGKPASAPKVDATVAAAYTAMTPGERRAIQSDLIWTGDYNGVIGDEFGERSIAAVKSYQARSGAEENGMLSSEQRVALAAAAKARQEATGWRVVDDSVTGARLAIPIKHAPQSSATASGTRWSSGRGEVQIETFRIAEPSTTLAAVFERQKKEPSGRAVDYSMLRENFFVVSGLQGLKRFYVRGQARGNEVRGVTILYDQAMQGIMDRVAVAMSSRFDPFPTSAVPLAARRKVEYATGIVVSESGHVITDRQAADGCYVITLVGHGGAERVAENADLVLLRLYGARNVKPLALAPQGRNPTEVTLVGIADPQAQGGNGATTNIALRPDAGDSQRRALDPAPPPGFAGAAAVNAHGELVGMALIKAAVVAGPSSAARAELVPADDIRTLLESRNVTPATAGATDLVAAKESVLRVICVRK